MNIDAGRREVENQPAVVSDEEFLKYIGSPDDLDEPKRVAWLKSKGLSPVPGNPGDERVITQLVKGDDLIDVCVSSFDFGTIIEGKE